MKKLYIVAEADRLTVAAILIKNKYRVRAGSQRRPGTKSYDYFLECETVTEKEYENRLYIEDEADQLTVGAILVKNKYTVRSYFQMKKDAKRYFFLEYEPNPAPEKKVEA